MNYTLSVEQLRDDSPTSVAAFTWDEVLNALADTYPNRLPRLHTVKSFRFRASNDALLLKLWNTPR